MIAGVFKVATETAANCYEETFNDPSRLYTLCNVPGRVLVVLPAHKGQAIQSWLSLKLGFNGQSNYGDLDCYKTMTPMIKFWQAIVLSGAAKILGTSVDDWKEPCTQCFKESKAFDVRHWREYESEGCSYLDYAPN
jgi:hypothetical protein